MSDSTQIEILLVEDNPDDVEMTLRALRKAISSITSKSSVTAPKHSRSSSARARTPRTMSRTCRN